MIGILGKLCFTFLIKDLLISIEESRTNKYYFLYLFIALFIQVFFEKQSNIIIRSTIHNL